MIKHLLIKYQKSHLQQKKDEQQEQRTDEREFESSRAVAIPAQ